MSVCSSTTSSSSTTTNNTNHPSNPTVLMGTRPKILADSLKRIEGLELDALAYADDVDASLRPYIDQLIKEELHRMSAEGITASSYLSELPLSSSSPSSSSSSAVASSCIEHELNYIQNRKGKSTSIKDEVLPFINQSIQKYDKLLPPNDSSLVPSASDSTSSSQIVETLRTHIERGQRSIEYQNLQALNLELLDTYGIPSWKNQIQLLDNEHKQLQHQNEELLTSIQTINNLRKSSQTILATKLQNLTRKYQDLTESNFYTELACQDMENETKRLRREISSKENIE